MIARSYFQSIPRKLEAILNRKEQGQEGQGCWHAVEPVPLRALNVDPASAGMQGIFPKSIAGVPGGAAVL